ncbi:hypothetical protein PUMCH_003936 [Australozyma saopauloensis]|uniref:Sorting nexin-4 n=1 Tax=Australozyma saopauloensis TaxID=291208 RepID=A0AAX4HDW5_9ASCO|nr:hypothetical protein PUMCH_003936 [[Candida] saopauloensis]
MSSDDAFTSVQWDREEAQPHVSDVSPIAEEPAQLEHDLRSKSPENTTELSHEATSTSLGVKTAPENHKNAEIVGSTPEPNNSARNSYEQPPPSYTPEESFGYNENTASSPVITAAPQSDRVDVEIGQTQGEGAEGTARNDENDDKKELRRMEDNFKKYKLQLEVSNPIFDKDPHGKLYISYLIITKTDHPDFKKLLEQSAKTEGIVTVEVRRRYRDFRFLSACLTNDFPLLMVPPLPPKLNFKYLTGDTFSAPFVNKRLSSLSRFVSFICEHKILSQLAVFHYFLSNSAEWGTFTKNLKILKNSGSAPVGENDGESSLVGKVVNEELLTETVMNFFTSSKHKRETNKDIIEISDKLKKLYENLIKLDKIFARLNKKNNDLKSDYEQFLIQVNRLAAIQISTARANDGGKSDPNASFTTTTSFDGMLSYAANCRVFSDSLLFFSNRWGSLHQYIDETFLVLLKDCAKYIIKFTDLIELQHNKKIDLQVLQDYLVKARTELANLGGATNSALGNAAHHGHAPSPALINHNRGGLVNNTTQLIKDTLSTSATPNIGSTQSDLKKYKLEQRIASLESEIAAQTTVVNAVTSQIINEEYPNWDRYNKKQLKQSMVDLCDREISFYKDLLENWKGVELKLTQRLDELQ